MSEVMTKKQELKERLRKAVSNFQKANLAFHRFRRALALAQYNIDPNYAKIGRNFDCSVTYAREMVYKARRESQPEKQTIIEECAGKNPQSIDCPKRTCRAKVGHFCDYIYGACHDERWRKVIRGW